jgi:IBR domain, a half RING-finger domain
MGGRKKHSPPSDDADTDDSGSTDKSSKHFQHLLQLVANAVARRGHTSTRQSGRKAGEEGEEAGSEATVREQVPLYERAQRHINKHLGIYQERPQSTHPDSILDKKFLRQQDGQLGEIISSQQNGKQPEKPRPAMASCFEKVAFELGQYRPKARVIELTCTVCFETLPLDDFPAAPITSTCLLEFHRIEDESFVCKSCINESIDAQLGDAKPDEISCPSCKQRMSHQDIKKWTEEEIFEKYDHMITLQAIQEDGSFIRCWRTECGGGQFHDGEVEFPIVICQECGAMTCYRHSGLPWHEGLTCDEFENPDTAIRMLQDLINDLKFVSRASEATSSRSEAQMTNRNTELESKLRVARRLRSERQASLASQSDKLGAKVVAETTKPCPQCHAPVEKTGGCKHMKCRCGFQFCYGCLVPWNLAHLATPCSEEHDHADVLNLARRHAVANAVHAAVGPAHAAIDPAHAAVDPAHAAVDPQGRAPRLHPRPPATPLRFVEAPRPRPDAAEATNDPPWLPRHEIGFFQPPAFGTRPQPPLAQARVPADHPRYSASMNMQRDLDVRIQRASHVLALGLTAQDLMDFVRPPFRLAPEHFDRQQFRYAVLDALRDPNLLHRVAHTQFLLHVHHADLLALHFRHWARVDQGEFSRDTNMHNLGRQYVEQGHMMRLSGEGIMRWADQDFAMRLRSLQDLGPEYERASLARFQTFLVRTGLGDPTPDLDGLRRGFN